MSFSRNFAVRRFLSPVVLAAVASVGLAGVQAPAAAQKKPKEQAAPKASYSKPFTEAYKPVETLMNAPTPDFAAAKAAVPGLIAASSTPDDKFAAGRMIFMIGQKSNDFPVAMQGIDLVMASGRADTKTQGQFAYAGGQIAYNLKDYAKSRAMFEAAIAAGYTENDPQVGLAESYFADKKYTEGLKSLDDAIAARKAAGQPVNESWIKRGLATAYSSQLNAEALRWGAMYAREFPSQSSWGDAIAIAINTGQFASPEMLDLLRLSRLTNTLRTRAMYLEYVDSADARKLPSEVIAVLDAGKSAKVLDDTVPMVRDARTVATGRLAADAKEIPALVRDANAAGAKLVTVMAAADTLLSYGKYAEAEALYTKAAAMPGVNLPLVLTRQGMAQVHLGKYAEAQATLAKVQGPRQPIANLWALYAAQKASGTVIAPSPAPTTQS